MCYMLSYEISEVSGINLEKFRTSKVLALRSEQN